MYVTGAILLTAGLASAAPASQSKRQSPGCSQSPFTTFPDSFKLAAVPLNDTASKVWLQAYDNAGSDPYQFLFGAGTPKDYASSFSYEATDSRLTTPIQNRTGTFTWKSLGPAPNQLLNFTTSPTDTNGGISAVEVSCGGTITYYAVAGNPAGPNYANPWALCQIPGWTTGLTEVKFAQDNTTLDSGCRRVGLSIET